MAEKLIIVMANTDPRNGEELGAPIFQATVAAAMDYEVDVICTATSGRLMKKGVAEKLFVKEGSPKSVYSFIQDAHEAGAKFFCCSPNLDLFDMTQDDLIPECEGIVGGRLPRSFLLARRYKVCLILLRPGFRNTSVIRYRIRRRSNGTSWKRYFRTSRRTCVTTTN
jgi:predicted peroxiredoxin